MSGTGALFLHRFGGSTRSWDGVLARLNPSIETSAPDLPGFGSAAASPGPFNVAAYADAAGVALHAMACDRVLIVGHSMGGKIALALAARRPDRLAGLVLLSPSPPTPEPMTADERSAALAGWGSLAYAEASLTRTTAASLGAVAHAMELDGMLKTSAAAWRAWFASGSREDISTAMTAIAVPSIILCGTADRTIPLDVQRREVWARLPDATLLEIPGTGHLLPVEAPDLVASTIAAACDRTATP